MAFETEQICDTTVSLLYAAVFGADGACVNVAFSSVIMLLIPFAVGVMVLQYFANRLLGFRKRRKPPEAQGKYGPGPIETTGAWRNKEGLR